MRLHLTATLLAASLPLAACGGDDDTNAANPTEPAAEPAAEPDTEPAAEPDTEPAAEPPAGPEADPTGPGTATLSLASGDVYEFGVLCSLEPQMAAGSEILFTAVSYDNPSLDITQFGDEGTITGTATVTVYDAETYDTLWEAGTFYEAVGGSFEVSLDGSVISGSGSFYPEADIAAEPVDGTFEADC